MSAHPIPLVSHLHEVREQLELIGGTVNDAYRTNEIVAPNIGSALESIQHYPHHGFKTPG